MLGRVVALLGISLTFFLVALYAFAVIACAVRIIKENRSPKATLAWLLILYIFPLVGLLIYFFLGRSTSTFSKETEMASAVLNREQLAMARHAEHSTGQMLIQIKTHVPASYNPAILRLVQKNSLSMLTLRNEATILQDATQFYPALLEDLRRAQQQIHMQYFIWSNDSFTQEVKEVLLARVKAGVKVRALYDASSKKALGQQYIEEMQAGGVEFLPYMAYNRPRTLHLANYRSHRKITIVDGRIAYVGGMNLDREQMPNTVWPRWRDTQVRIVGGAAQSLQTLFLANWQFTTGQQVADSMLSPAQNDVTNFLPIQITASGPDAQWKGIRQLYFFMIASAERTCYIQSPFFIPDATILEAMKSAALSGVDVRMICTPRGAKFQMPYHAARTYFREITEAGVKVYLYNGGYYHAKTITVDSAICTIGSCNMDIRSYDLDYEVNAVLYNTEKARELEAQFLCDLQESTLFTLEAYDRLPAMQRFGDSLWRLASPVM